MSISLTARVDSIVVLTLDISIQLISVVGLVSYHCFAVSQGVDLLFPIHSLEAPPNARYPDPVGESSVMLSKRHADTVLTEIVFPAILEPSFRAKLAGIGPIDGFGST